VFRSREYMYLLSAGRALVSVHCGKIMRPVGMSATPKKGAPSGGLETDSRWRRLTQLVAVTASC